MPVVMNDQTETEGPKAPSRLRIGAELQILTTSSQCRFLFMGAP